MATREEWVRHFEDVNGRKPNMDIPQVWNQFPIRNFLQNQPVHHPKGNYNHDKIGRASCRERVSSPV